MNWFEWHIFNNAQYNSETFCLEKFVNYLQIQRLESKCIDDSLVLKSKLSDESVLMMSRPKSSDVWLESHTSPSHITWVYTLLSIVGF